MRSLLDHLPFVFPAARATVFRMSIQLYRMPAWKIRQLSGDALFAFVNETGYLGAGAAKYIRDKADYRLDDAIKEAAPFPPASAKLFDVKRLPVRKLIVCNLSNSQAMMTRDSVIESLCKGFEIAGDVGCQSFVIPDPTCDWNYQTHRADPAVAANWLFAAFSRSRHRINAIKVLTTTEESFEAYKAELDRLKEVAPTINDFMQPTA